MSAQPDGTPPCLDAALTYARRGWRVFPLQPSKKIPFGGTRGVLEATTDEATIRRWFMRWPAANVAIACGNGLGVVDEDTYKGGDASPLSLPPTLTAKTPRGGRHMLYSVPGEIRPEHTGKLGQAIDYQGDGAYIVAPPSRVAGKQYAWANNLAVQPMPSNVLSILSPRPTKPTAKPAHNMTASRQDASDGMYWADKAAEKARGEGRNNAGMWLAAQLRDNRCSDPEGAMIFYATLVAGDGDHPYTEREALATWRSIDRRPPRDPARNRQPTPIRPVAKTREKITKPITDGASALDDAAQEDEKPPRFKFLVDTDVEDMPAPTWLIDKHLVAGKLAVVFGAYASAKSFLTLDWALCVATGLPWQGKAVQQGLVAYVAGEGIGGMGKRIKAWKVQHDWQGPSGLWMLGDPPQLLNVQDVIDLREAIDGLPYPPVMVVIDTLARSMVGGNENDAMDMGLAVAAAETIRRKYNCLVVIVHHKPSGADKTRGSTALPGAVDTTVDVSKDGDLITIKNEKQKDFATFEPMNLTLLVKALSEDPDDTSCVLISTERRGQERPLPKSAHEVLHYLKEVQGRRARFSEIQRYLAERCGMVKATVANALNELEERGFIYNKDAYWTLVETGY